MPVEAICDGCGAREGMWADALGNWHKPKDWYQANTPQGYKLACSQRCTALVGADVLTPPELTIHAETGLAWPIAGQSGEAMPTFPAVPEPHP